VSKAAIYPELADACRLKVLAALGLVIAVEDANELLAGECLWQGIIHVTLFISAMSEITKIAEFAEASLLVMPADGSFVLQVQVFVRILHRLVYFVCSLLLLHRR